MTPMFKDTISILNPILKNNWYFVPKLNDLVLRKKHYELEEITIQHSHDRFRLSIPIVYSSTTPYYPKNMYHTFYSITDLNNYLSHYINSYLIH